LIRTVEPTGVAVGVGVGVVVGEGVGVEVGVGVGVAVGVGLGVGDGVVPVFTTVNETVTAAPAVPPPAGLLNGMAIRV
jgi:hypothetical protein